MTDNWPGIINNLTPYGHKEISKTAQFNTNEDGTIIIDNQEEADSIVNIITEMDKVIDPYKGETRDEALSALREHPTIHLIDQGLAARGRGKETEMGMYKHTGSEDKWWQLPGVNKIVNWSKKLDEKNQIQNTVNDMEAAKVIEMLTAIDTALNKVAADRLAGAPRTKTSTGRDIPLTMSNVPEGDIIEELFGFRAGTMDLGKLQKLAIELIKSKPDDDKTKAVVALIVDAAMSHKESDAIYNGIQNLPQLKLMASVIAKGKPIKAKQAEINQQRIRDKYPGLSDTEIAAKQRQEIDDQRKKLGLDSVQTRFSKFTSLLTSHLANDQKDS